MSNVLAIDVGYSSTKVCYKGKTAKFPTAFSYAVDNGMSYGDNNVYKFEGEEFFVGEEAATGESFSTHDFKFLLKYAPLIIYHVLKKFDGINLARPVEIRTGLALVDWNKRDEFNERLSNIEVNGEKISLDISYIPQCAGIWNLAVNRYPEFKEQNISILDLGFNTINTLHFQNGRPVRALSNSYPGHGVVSVIKSFTSYMENRFALSFSNTEVIKYFVEERFVYNGVNDEEVVKTIQELKKQLVKRIFQSVLVNEKKTLATSDKVIISGGGAYMFRNVELPANVVIFGEKECGVPSEYTNVVGYSL